ncbi:antibiotic ABC transporter permease [Oceanidesulfovibrio indonesiensis]|uniref:Antibiotic ABC transporter permease n=1 Tax=Oceanidesulfovibrio indonesiensis TaxID=54767 RepID=A0A7M3MJ39_9BACT|nr:ABC transporter permease [Oceanidesulfovibrio indonesiensis]TVM19415.1 antibiotic ABC transporter permease [Oceanidesulfovibrio indonesiensis]
MDSIRRILALMVKEFLALLKDPRSRTVVMFPPIIQTILFGYAATFDLREIPYAVYDQSRSVESRELLAGLEGSKNFTLIGHIHRHGEIAELVDAGKVKLVVMIREDFARQLRAGNPATMQAILDGRNSNTASIVANYLTGVVQNYNLALLERMDSSERQLAAGPSVLVVRHWFNENLLSRWFFIPGLVGLIALLVTLLVTSLSVAREREHGTFDQLLVTPMPPTEILIGKALPGLIIGVLEATLILCIALFWFEIPLRGSLATLYAGLVAFIFAAVGIGLMISSLAKTMQQALLGTFLFMMPATLLSGFATPIENMAPVVQHLTVINPLRYIFVLLRGVFIEGASFALLANQIWPLAIIGACNLAAAGWLFRHRIY